MTPQDQRQETDYTPKVGDLLHVPDNGIIAVLTGPRPDQLWDVVILVGDRTNYWRPGERATASTHPGNRGIWGYPWTDELRMLYFTMRLEGKL